LGFDPLSGNKNVRKVPQKHFSTKSIFFLEALQYELLRSEHLWEKVGTKAKFYEKDSELKNAKFLLFLF